jgi:hypothetical protein
MGTACLYCLEADGRSKGVKQVFRVRRDESGDEEICSAHLERIILKEEARKKPKKSEADNGEPAEALPFDQ